ncbi:hypothetical protein B0T18DRAFT_179648 [Schizothecium vesticola]|uniref:Uncharacterized protein n=1 Tax=Schizothecium vesticola TaxID=314040 RepID=A0AA40K266_9PEZI|nr:hypothetical protein B0T18DRAFT_179648 [Schizothecium vesticola]
MSRTTIMCNILGRDLIAVPYGCCKGVVKARYREANQTLWMQLVLTADIDPSPPPLPVSIGAAWKRAAGLDFGYINATIKLRPRVP